MFQRLELDVLQEALAKDKGKKYKKKKQKKKRKGKKRGKKDQTANRMIEDLFQELVDNGVIRCYPPARLDEFLGDFRWGSQASAADLTGEITHLKKIIYI